MLPSNQDQSSQAASDQSTTDNEANSPAKKTGVSKIIADIEAPVESAIAFVGKEAGIIAKLFSQEEPAVQAALKQISQAVQVIKTNLNENPIVVSYLLRQINPVWSEDTLNGLLSAAAAALNVPRTILAPTLAETITNLQAHANQLPDEISHNNFWTGLFNTLGALVAPDTIWSKIITFGVYIYNTFIR